VPGTGGLVVERRVGRGRIVASAFALDNRELVNWLGFDTFFNSCLLGRPPREFWSPVGLPEIEFTGYSDIQFRWVKSNDEAQLHPFDARATCGLRYFSRDTDRSLEPRVSYSGRAMLGGEYVTDDDPGAWGADDPNLEQSYGPDVGSWSDFNAVAESARKVLSNAARVEIPKQTFVVWVVAVYVLVLVPFNWAVFRAMGRVEWAWIAAPVIALICTAVVIRLARLDIGFARSQTEISVIEIQSEYPRAYVTRYTALYTALSTTYGFRFEDPGAQILPFAKKASGAQDRSFEDSQRTLEYRYGSDVGIRGFHVQSNTTEFVHSEQMVDLGGPVVLADSAVGGYLVRNDSTLPLHGAGVIRRDDSGRLETAWIGTLEPGDSADLHFEWAQKGPSWADLRTPAEDDPNGGIRADADFPELVKLAENVGDLRPGDVRLVALADPRIPGLEIEPAAPQSQHVALVVAHLRHGHLEAPATDTKTRREAIEEEEERQRRVLDGSKMIQTPE
jgi:hypothetical protein